MTYSRNNLQMPEHVADISYWKKLYQLRDEYDADLKVYIEDQHKHKHKPDINNACILAALLSSTPKNHLFPCHIRLLEGAERQLKVWLR
mmetsp:Transcript_8565/g.10568  ORF Transcript_8565/g.10568 Transcript_8565/m.10568 type:complete len:89 (+) Transcript_8565:114-380(+)